MKLGICIDNLGASQLNYFLVKTGNAYLRENPGDDLIAFCESQTRNPLPANFAGMPVYEAYGFNGAVVATTLETAKKILGFPCPSKKYLYLWDVGWLRQPGSYREYADVYRHLDLNIIVRSTDHFRLFEDCWNRTPSSIIEDCDVADLFALVNEQERVKATS